MSKVLGHTLQITAVAVDGFFSDREAEHLLKEIIRLVGMTPYGDAVIRNFPTPEGLGGEGSTLIQPLIYQALVESFTYSIPGSAASDSYTWTTDDSGAYFVIASCKPFTEKAIVNFLALKGYNVLEADSLSVSLRKKTGENMDTVTPEQPNLPCLFYKQPYCPLSAPSLIFWKVTVGTIAILMLIFSFTLWTLSGTITKEIADRKADKAEILASNAKVLDTVYRHMQVSMENRAIQSEVRGMFSSLLDKRKDKESNLDRK